VRRLRQKSDLPVIFLTSKDEETTNCRASRWAPTISIRKPFSQRLYGRARQAVLPPRGAEGSDGRAEETDAKALDRGLLRHGPGASHLHLKNEPVTLTVTEF